MCVHFFVAAPTTAVAGTVVLRLQSCCVHAGRRVLLRMEYCISTGQDSKVSLNHCSRMLKWNDQFPDFPAWEAARLKQLRSDPSDWGAALGIHWIPSHDQ